MDAKDPVRIFSLKYCSIVAPFVLTSSSILNVFELNPDEVARYKAGEKQLTGFFMGQLMKVSKGKADPKLANGLLRQMLDA